MSLLADHDHLRAFALTLTWLCLGGGSAVEVRGAPGEALPAMRGGLRSSIMAVDMPATAWRPGDPLTWFGGGLTIDIGINERFEYRENWLDFNDDFDLRDDTALFQRLRFGLLIRPLRWLAMYAQLQDSRTFFDETSGDVGDASRGIPPCSAGPTQGREFVLSNSSLDLYQGWAQIGDPDEPGWVLRLGRQVLAYGDNRLIGPGTPWNNSGRSFDAAKARYAADSFQVDLLAGWVVLHKNDRLNDPDTADLLAGIYATSRALPGHTLDGYVLYRDKSDVEFSTVFSEESQQNCGNTVPPGEYFTFGVRLASGKGAFGPWDWNGELAIQAGDISNPLGFYAVDPVSGERAPVERIGGRDISIGEQDLLAFAAHIEVGHTFKTPWAPRIFVEYSYGSGDDDPSDGECGTFQAMFPTVHKYYGFMDLFGWQNLHNPAVGVMAKPTPAVDLILNFHQFWLDETEDPWRLSTQQAQGGQSRYGNALSGGTPVPGGSVLGKDVENGAPSSYVGGELDFMMRWRAAKWVQFEIGYCQFFAGDYVQDTAPVYANRRRADDARFGYAQMTFEF